MQFNEHLRPLIVILGPTAAGKTELAIRLAKKFSAEILSADSRQFYRGMDIGTAKPNSQQLQEIPHHFVDIANPDEIIGLSEFQEMVTRVIEDLHERNKLPFLVGGTGQYIRAVIEGWEIPPQPPNQRLREALSAWGNHIGAEALHEGLRALDPAAADFIQPQNARRTVRALEVIFSTGRKFSEQRVRNSPPYHQLLIGIKRDRQELYERIDRRIEEMVSVGLLEETKKLIDSGYSAELPSFSAIGYREMASVLRGNLSLEEAIVLMKRRTRAYVRRQANWFKESDPRIHWLEEGDKRFENADLLIQSFLSGKGDPDHLHHDGGQNEKNMD